MPTAGAGTPRGLRADPIEFARLPRPHALLGDEFMPSAADYRELAGACRRAARLSSRPNSYLRELVEFCEQQAAQLEAQFAGDKPSPSATRDTGKEKPRR